jgi:hypothetical protein
MSIIKIKRSSGILPATNLKLGEIAYSYGDALQNNGGGRLYIGTVGETNGVADRIDVIGGKYFTDMLDHAPGTVTASSAIIVDASSKINVLNVDNITIDGNTISSTNANGNIELTPNGTGYVRISGTNALVIPVGTTEQRAPATTGAIRYNTTLSQFEGYFASAWSSIGGGGGASTLNISGDSSTTDSIALTTDTLNFAGGAGITSTVTNKTVTFDIDDTVATLTGAQTLTNKTINGSNNTLSGIANTSLTNSTVTIGTTSVALGATSTILAGITELTIDNLNINGNTISSTDSNGDITLDPNGTGNIAVSGARITGVAEPIANGDAATKSYVDNIAAGLHIHEAAHCATTDTLAALSGNTVTYANGTLGVGATLTLTAGLAVIDGHTLTNGDRILVKNEATKAHNGIYVRTSAAVLTRAADYDTAAEMAGGDFTFVENGTRYGNTGWVQTEEVLTVGTDDVIWQQFSGTGTFTAGAGLTISGTEFNVGGTANRISVGTDAIDIASTYAGQDTIVTLGTVATGTWNATAIGATKGGTGITTYTAGDLLYASAANTLSKLAKGAEGQLLQINSSGLPVWGDIDGGSY